MDARSWSFRASSCIGKEGFSTPQLANKVKRRRAQKRETIERGLSTYKCKVCGLFHIGKDAKPRQNTIYGGWRFDARMEDDQA